MTKESLEVGNAAAIREAAAEFVSVILDKKPGIHNLYHLAEKCRDALAKPPRNCDVGTAEEQIERLLKFCETQTGCEKCPCNKAEDISAKCFARWSQMPYEKGVEE